MRSESAQKRLKRDFCLIVQNSSIHGISETFFKDRDNLDIVLCRGCEAWYGWGARSSIKNMNLPTVCISLSIIYIHDTLGYLWSISSTASNDSAVGFMPAVNFFATWTCCHKWNGWIGRFVLSRYFHQKNYAKSSLFPGDTSADSKMIEPSTTHVPMIACRFIYMPPEKALGRVSPISWTLR